MKKSLLIYSLIFLIGIASAFGQRKMEKLDRGVVAVRNASSVYFVSWRYLATDPEDIQFNLYAKKAGSSGFSKLNSSPLTVPNFQTSTGAVGTGTQLYVTTLIKGVESAPSSMFTVNATGFNTYRSAYLDITYNQANDGLDISQYSTKFVWPVDLDGDGEYDFVVDRLSTTGGTHKVQAYLRDGTLLWTVDMGPNVTICEGQDDMVIAYDMDGDGKGDVVVKSSDGTVFADGKGVFGSTTLDTDDDGIIDYSVQNVKNPPQYITCIDGMTGNEKNSIEMQYPSNYTRTNKDIFMGTEYSNLNGFMAIVYLDGKHPSVGFIYKTRTSSDKYHWYYASAYGYNQGGQWVNWYNWERGYQDAAEFHSIRSADVDLDGRDELHNGGYGIKYDGSLAYNAHISHGDRFRIGDVDPERPGLETFAIQQNASDMLGMLLYESPTGNPIKKIFMSAVGDVGRGECMDIDSTHLGYEMFSTMANIYDAKGNIVYEGSTPFPNEGVWWDGDLQREELTSSDGNGFNADIRKYSISSHDFGTRLIEFAKMTNWQVRSEWGRRPAFFGDIAGDWREEVVLEKHGYAADGVTETCPGIVAFSTDYPTSIRLYCLMQNPAYRMQATTKGYYQSAFPDYYLGYKMPEPPLPPIMSAKLTWSSGSVLNKTSQAFLLNDEKTTSAFTDGDDMMFDISGNNASTIQMNTDLAPSKIWAMNPLGKDYTISGTGKFTGNMELVKSMNGKFTLNGNQTYTGNTVIHEGVLAINGSLASPVDIRAKGTLSGNAILNAGIAVHEALNIEGGRLAPGNGLEAAKLGKMTINSNLTLSGKTNLHFDIIPSSSYKNDSIVVNGNLTLSGINNIVVNTLAGTLPSGSYSLLKWTGALTGTVDNFNIEGISGIPVTLLIENNTLKLVVDAVRSVGKVSWTGLESSDWDFISGNFKLNNQATYFVTGDSVEVNDNAILKTINLTDNFSPVNIQFNNNSSAITLKGTGGIIGETDFEKTGEGILNIETANNGYTGITKITDAVVQVVNLADAGYTSSLGSSSAEPTNFELNNSKLIVNSASTNSNKGITLSGNDTINVIKSNGVVSLSGVLIGSGILVKDGTGQLSLSGSSANTYSGGTVILHGKLALGSLAMNSNGLGTGPVTLMNGSTLSMFYNTGDYNQKPNWNLIIPENQVGTLVASGRCAISGSISGAGTLNYYIPYVRADLVAGGQNFTGILNVTTDADGGQFRITTNTIGFPSANVNLSANVEMSAYATVGSSTSSTTTTVKVGSLSGVAGSTLGSGKWIIGSDNRDALFNGVINSGATITKVGDGSWMLTQANLLTTPVLVNGGTLVVLNSSGSATGTGTVTVNNSGTLAGTGTVSGGVIINSGGTIMPGNTVVGTLNLGNSMVLQSGSKLMINVSGTNCSKLEVAATAILKGTLEMKNTGSFLSGASYQIITANTISGSFDSISPVTPGNGLQWDISRISEGIISVMASTDFEDIINSTVQVYPSQVNDYCIVSVGGLEGRLKIELIDEVGRIVLSEITDASTINCKISMSTLRPGFYLVKVTSEKQQTYIRKIVKQ
ncbi:MAG: autotransporter-associated beta strand repeat-containing protein [Paludibacter sp.]|nr:autotransporter-associated beta strand repeat-containing protein [Paludibacter sp.]